MSELASQRQLRMGFLRWLTVLVPGILLLGVLSGEAGMSGPDSQWFANLVKPDYAPPPAAFTMVWVVLYIVMGGALALVVAARGARWRTAAILAFLGQLLLNLAWSPLFFAAHRISGALLLLGVLDLAVLACLVLFLRVRSLAGLLLLPYLGWLLFATLLNWQFLTLNPDADGQFDSGAAVRIQL